MCCFSYIIIKSEHGQAASPYTVFLTCWVSCINECCRLSFHSTHTPKTRTWNTSLLGLTGCKVGFLHWSLYIHLLPLLPWQGKEQLCLQNLCCSHFPALPSRLAVAMETSRMSITALCVRHAGRGDMMCFSPPLWLSLCCVRGSRLQHRWSVIPA